MSKKHKQVISRIGVILVLTLLTLSINRCSARQELNTSQEFTSQSDLLEVHFIDVGQGDAILIEKNNESMLIDAGENNQGDTVVDYLTSQNIKELDYVVETHPHSDHIGGMDTVLNSFQIDQVIMPNITSNTKTYKDVTKAIDSNNLTVTTAEIGDQYSLGSATFTIVGPIASSYEDINNYSVVIKLTYGSKTFLFTGDAEKLSEEEMIKSGEDLSADVLKLGHHGSESSCSEDFLNAVKPTYAVISVGTDNEFGHPRKKTLKTLSNHNIKVYRTDKQKNIIFTSDGNTLSVYTGSYK